MQIGQYALCSIQRKQHSDTVDDNAGEGSSRKRTRARNVDPEKTKKKRTTNKAAATKRTARKNKTSSRAKEGQHQPEEPALHRREAVAVPDQDQDLHLPGRQRQRGGA